MQIDDRGRSRAREGYTIVKGNEFFDARPASSRTTRCRPRATPRSGPRASTPRVELAADAPLRRRRTTRSSGSRTARVFKDNGQGSFVAANGEELEPGWKTTRRASRTSTGIIHDPLDPRAVPARVRLDVRFAILAVADLVRARPLPRDHARQAGDALPALLPRRCSSSRTRSRASSSLLVWQGLLNDDFGVVNQRPPHRHPVAVRPELGEGLRDPRQRLADVPVLLPRLARSAPVDPRRADEAARVDGGGAWQVFRKVTLPLLLIVVAPLMIASFAFNFNNFNNIYLLTGGGPQSSDQPDRGRHGHPDQLHVQARLRGRQGPGLRRSRARSRSSSSSSSPRSPRSRSGGTKAAGEPRDDAPSSRSRLGAAPRSRERRRKRRRPSWRGHVVAPRRRAARRAVRALPGRVHRLRGVQRRPRRSAARSLIPRDVTLDNFTPAAHTDVRAGGGSSDTTLNYLRWFANTMIVAGCDRDPDRAAQRARGVRVQPLPLQGPAHGDGVAAADPDVPAAARSSSRST